MSVFMVNSTVVSKDGQRTWMIPIGCDYELDELCTRLSRGEIVPVRQLIVKDQPNSRRQVLVSQRAIALGGAGIRVIQPYDYAIETDEHVVLYEPEGAGNG